MELNVYSDSMGNPLHAAQAIHSNSSAVIQKRLSKARRRANEIAEALESLETEDQREVYLVQRFLVDSLRGFRRSIVYGYFFSGFDWKRKSQSMIIPQLCFAGIPAYLLFAALFIFLYGVQIGQGATTFVSNCLGYFGSIFIQALAARLPGKRRPGRVHRLGGAHLAQVHRCYLRGRRGHPIAARRLEDTGRPNHAPECGHPTPCRTRAPFQVRIFP